MKPQILARDWNAKARTERRHVSPVRRGERGLSAPAGVLPAHAPLRIMGNLHNVHDHPRFLALLPHLHIHTVWTPTDASWLNAIEAHFGVTKRATLTGSDDRDHVPSRRRIYRYLHYRNRRVDRQDHPLTRIRSVRP
jgi:hypothetical protein